jgi:tetratricopeptide (TPR) repeat protein
MRHLGYSAALAAAFSLSAAVAAANCQLQQLGTLPVDMQGLRPLVSTRINGVEARFALDSGSFFSTIWRDTATQYQLPVGSAPGGAYSIRGAGGDQEARVATVKLFEFLGLPLRNIPFLVIDQTFSYDYVGLIGQNVLRLSDVEYDLANGLVRFFKPIGCERQPLAYWAVSTPYTTVDLQPIDAAQDHLIATALVNGKRVTVYFDTGAPRSYLSLQAAERAGIRPDGAGVTFLGLTGGLGPGTNKVWSAPVDSFQLGGEKVQHTHLLISDLDPAHQIGEVGDEMPDMLLGEDFFLSHRVYVAYGQRKLYLTYNGGPLFNLFLPGSAAKASAATGEQPYADTPTDADGFRRQGMAYAAMQEFDLALADLTRACTLAPKDADARYDRGLIHGREGQYKPALQDFSTAITLQPDDIDARLARADLLQSHPDTDPTAAPEVKSDLDAVSRLSPPAASVRLALAQLYDRAGDYPAAMEQLDQWLSNHQLPGDRIAGLNERCWLRATSNRDLRLALDDCDEALDLRTYSPAATGTLVRSSVDDPNIIDSRGLVYLRLGKLDAAIHDYDSALHINPNMPTSLYGRGLAELRLGQESQGQADLAAAKKLDGGVAKTFADMGLAP